MSNKKNNYVAQLIFCTLIAFTIAIQLFLFYELRKGEEASPETILSREFPKSIIDDICYGLMPDFDPDKTTDFPVR